MKDLPHLLELFIKFIVSDFTYSRGVMLCLQKLLQIWKCAFMCSNKNYQSWKINSIYTLYIWKKKMKMKVIQTVILTQHRFNFKNPLFKLYRCCSFPIQSVQNFGFCIFSVSFWYRFKFIFFLFSTGITTGLSSLF